MQEIKSKPILKFNNNQLSDVRKALGYEDANKLKQDIEQIDAWIKLQSHFRVKEFDHEYLERLLIFNKGSIERAKQRLDKLFTCTNLMPEFLQNFDLKNEFIHLFNTSSTCVLPKPLKNNYRVIIADLSGNFDNKYSLLHFCRYCVVYGHYLHSHDYCLGYELVGDTRNLTMGLLGKFEPVTFQKALKLFTEVMALRIGKMHLITDSKLFDTGLTLLKQVLSTKLKERIIIHTSIKSLQEHIPKEILPKDYGGDERTIQELHVLIGAVIMNSIKDGILKFHPDTVVAVRKEINLDKPGRMDEALNLLEEWVKMQSHFMKKEFPRRYLETTLISSKGLVERAKQKIDKLCTFRTLIPEFFPSLVTKSHFTPLLDLAIHAHLPVLTKEHHRVYLLRMISNNFEPLLMQLYYQYIMMACEYLKIKDYNSGLILVADYRDVNILSFVTKVNPVEAKHALTLMTEGYDIRVKRIDVISESKMVDTLVLFMKQVVSAKIGSRIHVHKSLDTLHEAIGKDIMPVEYGGKEKPLRELNDIFLDTFCSKEFVDFFKEINEAKTDESCRQTAKFNEDYMGMPGSFRVLSVD